VTPLIFIPGIAGSILRSKGPLAHNIWPSEPFEYLDLNLDPNPRSIKQDVIASDVIRFSKLKGVEDIYGSFLNFLARLYPFLIFEKKTEGSVS